ncbi:hypothetical protein SAMN05444336_101787 [Albimonas donghaensis]|uniref:Haemolysin XhlA n=1 Tax=Albimonas donghaensis TaxID=356660 RepID=A0A1H2SVA2_9RHOB|nr:hypothetical protein [Albimonas donghaensis]MAS44762.1 hypothetical protein [Paracoccaceae bacterium]MBR28712.1 hypothetical protein [Paracoccaceae bacterium]SDW35457.1 hypothetical protein SAMN05444336_101787 [Albimonas donghaensis]
MRNSLRTQSGGSKFLYEPFDSAHARIEALERVLDERWAALERSLDRIDHSVERLEKRLWLAVFAVATALVSQFAAILLDGRLNP